MNIDDLDIMERLDFQLEQDLSRFSDKVKWGGVLDIPECYEGCSFELRQIRAIQNEIRRLRKRIKYLNNKLDAIYFRA